MNLSKYRCLNCHANEWRTYTTYWQCAQCGQQYPCSKGVPRLYLESRVGPQDRALRDYFYNGLLGRYYQHIMPFLALPVRPAYKKGWLVYSLVCGALLGLIGYVIYRLLQLAQGARALSLLDLGVVVLLGAVSLFFARHRYLLYLLILAVPVKLSLRATTFRPRATFTEIHASLIAELQQRQHKLQVLDISTGTCNSLYRHGWMKLDAEYTGLDLSETMLLQGLDFMAAERVPMDFVLGDAMQLPFQAETFDVVLNYGALNGYSDAARALAEMARVAKSGGLVLVLDEQLYAAASTVERFYFRRVLSNHNVYHRCPVELLPPELAQAEVHQVYHFYYLCAGYKQ
jgi:ubiquinone/menaquinone biosynthesis C-methylase UbiE